MTVRLGWDSSLRLRSVQNDNRVIPSAREESLVTTTWGKILHFTAFHSERHCTVRATSLNRRCFAIAQHDKQMSFHARTVDRREIPGNKNSYRHTAGVLKETDGKGHNLHFFPAVAISSIISSGGSGKSGKEARREDRTSPNPPPRI